ncbi:Methionine aminopeptidase 1, partial [Coelomomyces lativittatus]
MTQDTSPKVDEVTMEPPLLHRCNGVHCFLPASLSCPTCLKLNVPKSLSRFCSQTCFKNNWSTHKVIHAPEYDPFQHQFNYTGSLRAVYPLSPMRTLPPHIQRPDYAES